MDTDSRTYLVLEAREVRAVAGGEEVKGEEVVEADAKEGKSQQSCNG
jgi:hypothetical protein